MKKAISEEKQQKGEEQQKERNRDKNMQFRTEETAPHSFISDHT